MLNINYSPLSYLFTSSLPTEIVVTKRKLDLGRSTATCLVISTFYDDNTAYEYEVESAMLTIEEANHISFLLLSPSISIVQDNAPTPILITDITNEISDADNATNTIKFKYKYARHNLPISLKFPQNIFDDPSTARSTNSTATHEYYTYKYPKKNPRFPRTSRPHPLDQIWRNPTLASLHLPQIRFLQRHTSHEASRQQRNPHPP